MELCRAWSVALHSGCGGQPSGCAALSLALLLIARHGPVIDAAGAEASRPSLLLTSFPPAALIMQRIISGPSCCFSDLNLQSSWLEALACFPEAGPWARAHTSSSSPPFLGVMALLCSPSVADSDGELKLTHLVWTAGVSELRIILMRLWSCSLFAIEIIALMFLSRIFFFRVSSSSFSPSPNSNMASHDLPKLSLDRL